MRLLLRRGTQGARLGPEPERRWWLARPRTGGRLEPVWIGDPVRTGTSRTNPRTGDSQVLATKHALLMADLDPTLTPAVL